MVDRKKKTKICDKLKVSHKEEEDRISQLPEHLISEILYHLSTKDAVRTSVLSTRWRYLWQSVPGLDLSSYEFSKFDAFASFVERFFISHRESWIRKLSLSYYNRDKIPLSLYTCETLVHLQLCNVTMCNAEFVSLPCLKFMYLGNNKYRNETTLQKLISGSPVLEHLTITRAPTYDDANVVQVRSHTLKTAYICEFAEVLIDAPLLQSLKATVSSTMNFQIVNLGSSAKLDFDLSHMRCSSSMIHDILTCVPLVRELVISNGIRKEIFQYSKPGPLFQFRDLSRLNVEFSKFDLATLPTLLQSCPKLESLVMKLVKDRSMCGKKNTELKVMFSTTVPHCLVSSLKVVEWRRSIAVYEGELELVRYFLKNSKILEKLKLDVYYAGKSKCAFLQELLTMPRCSSVCELHCSVIPKNIYC
ncbi:PREDICTED: F-box/FBD/LRR-repeat protein At1g51370-like [Camelina sativa]|uniref:F-box/FBD/LRR-repeat protein At1g51370-like n=1 Tax=Camelina sativa TaxID=90675 RepID=A0ABM0WML8_CAMSA|nr:PREDICTED: F-box/FBD/LRR-repeat protein At1g51370-like [Camelina sativa]